MTDPVREYGKFCTRRRNVGKWKLRRLAAIEAEAERQLFELTRGLSPAAARIMTAAEGIVIDAEYEDPAVDCQPPAMVAGDPEEPPLPDWTKVPPPEVPPGGVVVVEDKPGRRSRG